MSKPEMAALRAVIENAVASTTRASVASSAGVHDYHLKYFLQSEGKSNHQAGLRLLRYAAAWTPPAGDTTGQAHVQVLQQAVGRMAVFDPDDDFFFHHLVKLGLLDSDAARRFCARHAGNYYAYRLGRTQETVLRSHIEIKDYNPYSRIPIFRNRLYYPDNGPGAPVIKRTAFGQVIPVGDSVAFIGFVYHGFDDSGTKHNYRGIQLNIFSRDQFDNEEEPVIHGIFLSYIYGGRYEYGPLRLVRGAERFTPANIRPYSFADMQKLEPRIDVADLSPDFGGIAKLMHGHPVLTACLSFLTLMANPPAAPRRRDTV